MADGGVSVKQEQVSEIGESNYQRNKEKIRAYNRLYNRKMRADPVKREQINNQKRDMMRRLSEKRRQDGSEQMPVPKKPKNQARRDHKTYYAEHVEAMRQANRKYTQKIRADPERRAAINEKKKLAMRRLKERRQMEANNSLKLGDSCEVTIDGTITDSQDSQQCPESIENWPETTIEEEIIEEEVVEESIEDPTEVIIETPDDTSDSRVDLIEEEEVEQTDDENFEDIFPSIVEKYRSQRDDEMRGFFVEYIEECAEKYYNKWE